jgi:diguanylate cyclase (GGDEF)-like protein
MSDEADAGLDWAHFPPDPHGYRLGGSAEAYVRSRIHRDDAQTVMQAVGAATAARIPYTIEYRMLRPDDTEALVQECGFFDRDAPGAGYATLLDVTARRRRERENWHAAYFDSLTGLPNRKLFTERVAKAVRAAEATGRSTAVLVWNIDKFRETNAMFGRAIGNELLKLLGARLAEVTGNAESVAHLGLDIFGVLLTDVDTRSSVTAVVRALIAAVAQPFVIGEQSYQLTLSVGISGAPEDGSDAVLLLRSAYAAMSAVKGTTRSAFCWYSAEMAVDAASAGRRRSELIAALANGDFDVHYQPIVDLVQDRVVAVEALARWNHPQRGFVAPAEFIALADSSGLIVPLGEWVLREACAQAQRWHQSGVDVRVCVNVSAVQFRQPDFAALVGSILHQTGLAPDRLELELTESVMVDGFDQMIETLSRLKSLGLRLAIDDFGTGYSSLAYLKHFPIDTLKIDRAFVTNIASDAFDRAIATTVMTLATELGFDCVVEGVETREQLETLRAIGCTIIQGFLFGRPASAHDLRVELSRPAGLSQLRESANCAGEMLEPAQLERDYARRK